MGAGKDQRKVVAAWESIPRLHLGDRSPSDASPRPPCAGVPAYSVYTIAPTSVTPGASPAAATVTIKTTAATAQLLTPGSAQHPVLAVWTLAAGFGMFGMFLIGSGPRWKRASVFLVAVLGAGILFLAGCGSTSTPAPVQKGNATPPGTYTVLVIGASGRRAALQPTDFDGAIDTREPTERIQLA
jgi:hypothetical protein